MSSTLSKNASIQASLQKLRNIGLRASVIEFNENWIAITVTSESIINYITRTVEKYITYPNHFVEYDQDTKMLVIHFWKGDVPWQIRMKVGNQMK